MDAPPRHASLLLAVSLALGISLVPAREGALISGELIRRSAVKDAPDWRTWNLSRARASAGIQEHLDSLITSSRPIAPTP
jgi:hypothetical protein